jgi:hypothetical protein
MRWRQWINLFVMTKRAESGDKAARLISDMGATTEALERAWAEGHYDDQAVPINVLMNHSDSHGDIPVEVCGPLADVLRGLLDQMPERGIYDEMRPATLRFIRGLRLAAERNEAVRFG